MLFPLGARGLAGAEPCPAPARRSARSTQRHGQKKGGRSRRPGPSALRGRASWSSIQRTASSALRRVPSELPLPVMSVILRR